LISALGGGAEESVWQPLFCVSARLYRSRKRASNRFLRGWSPLQAKHLLSELKLRPP